MAGFIGKIEQFDENKSNWESYQERIDVLFTVNNIEEEAKKVPLLLSWLGAEAYTTLRNLLAPDKPATQTYKKLTDTLTAHYAPKPLVIAERFRFYNRDQSETESVNVYVAELRRLASTCDFNAFLGEALRDRFVCGLHANNEHIQKRLLTEADLTLKKAVETAVAMEMAAKDATELQHKNGASVNKIGKHFSGKCYRCGRKGHNKNDCRFKEALCHNCNRKGHIKAVCKSGPKSSSASGPKSSSASNKKSDKKVKAVDTDNSEDTDDEILMVGALGLHSVSDDIIWITPQVNGQDLKMEVDTGSAVSIISYAEYKAKFGDPKGKLKDTSVKLKTYTGERVTPVGTVDVNIEYKGQTCTAPLYILSNEGTTLFGRDWLRRIKLDWHEIKTVTVETVQAKVDTLKQKHQVTFADGFGKLDGAQGKLYKKENAQPKFMKARHLPYAMRPKVERELTRLQEAGIISPVKHSEWATPIVPVLKPNGSIRLCGDFKATVNPRLNIEQYPLPKIDDIFANLAGGQYFSKLDLTQAYLQLEMDEASREMLTINTHRGLFRYNRLAYGVASAPAIWQRTMEQVFQDIPGTQVMLDDIIVTGKTNEEHLSNLSQVLERIQEKGLKLNDKKCEFFKAEIEFCGHKIDRHGLHKTTSKIDAVLNAPAPTNVSELKAFLGLINYYRKFLPNLATVLHPLNQLLCKHIPWKWTKKRAAAFQEAKQLITSDEVLTHYDPELPIRLACDASPYGLGAVISHVMPDQTERPIAYASRSLSKAETNYAQIDKEALGIVWGVEKFNYYLACRHFTLVTDHKPLTAIFNPSSNISVTTAQRLTRYAIFLAGYDYDIEYRSTTQHCNADGLSRLPLDIVDPDEDALDMLYVNMSMSQCEPLPVSAKQVKLETQRDVVLSRVHELTRLGWTNNSESDPELKPFFNRKDELSIADGCVMWGLKVVIPSKLRKRVLDELHEGHLGVVKMKNVARGLVWWPGIDKEIEGLAKQCSGCQSIQSNPATAPLHVWEWPAATWDRVHIDYAGPIQGQMYLVVVDAYSKWPFVVQTKSTTSETTIRILLSIFATEGLCKQLVSDNAPQFTSEEFESFLRRNGIKHITSAPYHPATNGIAERFVQTFKNGLKAAKGEKGSDHTKLMNFLMAYRNAPHSTTGVAPALLFRGHTLRSRLDLMKPQLRDSVNNKQADQATNKKSGRQRDFNVGQTVSVRDYRDRSPKWIPGVIVEKTGPLSYRVKVGPGSIWRRHVDQLLASEISQPVTFQQSHESMFPVLPSVTARAPETSVTQATTAPSASVNVPETNRENAESSAKPAETQVASAGNQEQTVTRRYPSRIRRAPDKLDL